MPTKKHQQLQQEITSLQRELDELNTSLPKHSIKASQLIRIEELEDQIAEKKAMLARLTQAE
jgi:replicative DNA helicase